MKFKCYCVLCSQKGFSGCNHFPESYFNYNEKIIISTTQTSQYIAKNHLY